MEYMQDWVFVKILLSIYLPEKNENCIWLKYVQIGQLINLRKIIKQNDFVFTFILMVLTMQACGEVTNKQQGASQLAKPKNRVNIQES